MTVIGARSITLNREQMMLCQDFANKSAKSQQPIEFGSHDTKPRKFSEIARDNLIGKLAEVAFGDFLSRNFGISTQVDFNIYPRSQWDDNDLVLNGRLIDIKATRSGGRWLLIDLNKLEFRKKEAKLPAYFVFAVTGWIKKQEGQNIKEYPTGTVVLKGYAPLNKMCHPQMIGRRSVSICEGIAKTLYLPKGSFIPNTWVRLQADNCARFETDLETDWTKLMEHIGIELVS